MVGGRAVAGFSVGRADTMPVLRNLDRSPIELRQSGDQSSHNAGLAYAARVSADHDDGHRIGLRAPSSGLANSADKPNRVILEPEARRPKPEACLFTFSPTAPASPVASDTRAAAAPEFPRRFLLCRAEFYW